MATSDMVAIVNQLIDFVNYWRMNDGPSPFPKEKRAAAATLYHSVPACAQPRRIDVPA